MKVWVIISVVGKKAVKGFVEEKQAKEYVSQQHYPNMFYINEIEVE